MRKIKEVLRLKYQHGLSARRIARSCGIARSTVAEYLMRAKAVGLEWLLFSLLWVYASSLIRALAYPLAAEAAG